MQSAVKKVILKYVTIHDLLLLLLLLLLLTRGLAWRLVQKLQGHVTHKKDDVFARQRKKQEGQQRHQYEVANKYVFKCHLKVYSDDDDVTNDGKLFHARAAATGKAQSPIPCVMMTVHINISSFAHLLRSIEGKKVKNVNLYSASSRTP